MKIAISCDKVLERDYAIKVVEALLVVYPDAELYTFVHKSGSVLGPLEQRKIHSSYLTHLVNCDKDFWRQSFLIPSAAKKLKIPCRFDLIINVSSGLSQGIDRCASSKQISYVLGDEFLMRATPSSFREKLFGAFVKDWSLRAYQQADLVWVTSEEMKKKVIVSAPWLSQSVEVLDPFIKMEDYPLFPDAQSLLFPKDTYLVEAEKTQLEQASEISTLLTENKLKFKFVGRDSHLRSLKDLLGEESFFGDRCAGEMTPLLAGAMAYINLNPGFFPERAIGSLAVGRPVVLGERKGLKPLLNNEGAFFTSGVANLAAILDEVKAKNHQLESKKMRARVQKFNDIKFKAEVKRRVDRVMT